MARIEPFRAVIYNPGEIRSLSSVVCPPYDIISTSQQQYYHNLHPYNFIHILLGRDIPGEDKYRRAAHLFSDWQKNKILVPDRSPAIYFYSQEYSLKGEKRTRLGFIARLYLEDKNSTIYTHEHTRLEPKEDRLRLLKAVGANLSPIFVIFPDRKRVIQQIYQKYIQGKNPFVDIVNDDKVTHKLWRLDYQPLLNKLQADMQNENIFIADGHHRYEVACAYRDEMKRKLGTSGPEAGFNYILAYFTNTNSSGLTILPIHRLVKFAAKPDISKFISSMKDYFDVEEVKDKIRFFFLMEKGARGEHVLGMYCDKKYRLLRLKNIKILDRMLNDKPAEFRSLDVSILNYIVLKKILGIDLEDKDALMFSPNTNELIEKADNDNSHIAFFLNPAKAQQIISLALTGQNMPAKSTYFYPKVLSGLVINKFE
ncbi:MAG: DUF1015 domain-containing protein [Candidatus Omnitrophota bacterium]|nr:DUF1015 domain-containing protein [Candidatus Omnitrophota bacterium]